MRAAPALGAISLALVTAAVYAPALRLELLGDDYQWLQHANAARHEPRLLLTNLGGAWRPTNTWTLALDLRLFGHAPFGFHLTNLVLHVAAAVLLVAVARRYGLSARVALALAVVWATSPLVLEPVAVVASRHYPLFLIGWLLVLLAAPRAGEPWSPGRVVAVAGCLAFAGLSLETGVTAPLLLLAHERFARHARWPAALKVTAASAVGVASYLGARFSLFPAPRGYYNMSLGGALGRIADECAAFLQLAPLAPVTTRPGHLEWLALAAVAVLGILGLRSNDPARGIGVALMAATILPTLPVPFLPTRYTYLPFAGFLLLIAGTCTSAVSALRVPLRRIAAGAAAFLVVSLLVAGWTTIRADLRDLARVSAWHARLLAEARAVVPTLKVGLPVAVVRAEADNPLYEVSTSVLGWPKLFFVRHSDPYGLIDAAALFEWVLDGKNARVRQCGSPASTLAGTPGAVLVHRRGGFEWQAGGTLDIAALAAQLEARGIRFQVIRREGPSALPWAGGAASSTGERNSVSE